MPEQNGVGDTRTRFRNTARRIPVSFLLRILLPRQSKAEGISKQRHSARLIPRGCIQSRKKLNVEPRSVNQQQRRHYRIIAATVSTCITVLNAATKRVKTMPIQKAERCVHAKIQRVHSVRGELLPLFACTITVSTFAIVRPY
jgi:hypothetical protein